MAQQASTSPEAAQMIRDISDIHFVSIALIILGTWFAVTLVKRTLPWIAERGPNRLRLWLLGAVPIFRLVATALAVAWIIPLVFKVTVENFLVIAGAIGVAVGFAFKDYISSLIAGVVAQFETPWRAGDWVKIGSDYGEVRSVGMRAIKLRTLHDDIITVPNLKLWDSNVANSNDGERTLMCVADFYIAPHFDTQRMRAALRDVALTSAWLCYDKPIIVFVEQTEVGTHIELRCYPFEMRDQGHFISDLTVRGKEAIRALGAREVAAPAAAS
ncbi:Small-conductance mechanosensitive channel [Kushneria avicenniae]|uniref:Small-conductance mechanosensitive channel n=1 Tax=Kushneria avicenniae TaxID=402385 RepID=A0A1I1JJA1_9GAMM|nr:mechanosensitive ion channel domain-containing protein [Kushneria avicenniae]SFC48042.1 Small-conductance mechanosensitive channel [Kushneria avicenniae]